MYASFYFDLVELFYADKTTATEQDLKTPLPTYPYNKSNRLMFHLTPVNSRDTLPLKVILNEDNEIKSFFFAHRAGFKLTYRFL